MLLAAAGQAAPYTYESSAARKINNNNNNNNNSSSSSSSSKNNVSSGNSTSTPTTGAAAAAATTCNTSSSNSSGNSITSNAATALMKTLSVRLHRGTEFIKDTVQKALVMSATTPVIAAPPQAPAKQPDTSHKLKRKVYGTGGIMGTSAETSLASRQFVRSQPYIKPTPAFLRHFAVAPSALHRSASARKRNPSTDSLLMDMCLFKPIRPMPITPIKINKARGFELKRPKFMPPASNLYSEDEDDDDDDEEDDEVVEKEQEAPKEPVALKPKLSTLTLPQNVTASAFVLHEAGSSIRNTQTKDNSNTHTSGSGSGSITVAVTEVAVEADTDAVAAATDSAGRASAKPKKVATKRRRRAPLLTARRRRKPASAATANAKESATKTAATAAAAPKRKRLTAAATTARKTISPMLRSPPMTRQRARLQISTSK